MFVPFEKLAPTARIWIYQSNKEFSDEEILRLEVDLQQFISNWTAHQQDLKGSYKIIYKRFIVLVVDENFNSASGCSIDKSVHFIQNLEQKYQSNLMDRMNFAYKIDGEVYVSNQSDFQKQIQEKIISSDTLVFNNLIKNKAELTSNWEILLKDSWHARIFDLN